jgi:hypothetical protein
MMRNGVFSQRVALLAIVVILSGICLAWRFSVRQRGGPPVVVLAATVSSSQKTPSTETDDVKAQAKARPDHFVVMLSGNWQGRMEPCGCADGMLGGIDRRTFLIDAVPAEQRLLLDIGSLVETDQLPTHFEAFLYSLKQLNYDAISLTPMEMKMLKERGIGKMDFPPLVATNLDAASRKNSASSVSCLEKKLQSGDYSLDCLVVGVAEPGPVSDGIEKRGLSDPVSAVKKTLQTKNVDPNKSSAGKFVVLLAASQDMKFIDRLRVIRGVDLIVCMDYDDRPNVLSKAGQSPLVVTVGNQGKYMTRLDIPFSAEGAAAKKHLRAIPIREIYPKDKAVMTIMQDYLDSLMIEAVIAEEMLPRESLPDGNMFVGSETCASCHQSQYDTWQDMAHSHALTTLKEKPELNGREFDPRCVRCHTVGMDYYGGYRSVDDTPELAHVGCEQCHGPGDQHAFADDPAKVKMRAPFMRCEQCHDAENDPKFEKDYEMKFKKIKHWKGKRSPLWHPHP